MSVIIRLQNLPWSANSVDIRQFFHGLSIPEGGVHIVGGEFGDAFIAFSTDEDARQAMMMDGKALKGEKVRLLLSSRAQMYQVIEEARKKSQQQMAARMSVPVAPQVSAGPAVGSMSAMVAGPLLPVQMPSQVPAPAPRTAPMGGSMLPSTPEQLAALMSQMAGMPGMETVLQSMPALAGLAPRLMQSMGHPMGAQPMGQQSMGSHSMGPHQGMGPQQMGPQPVGPPGMGPPPMAAQPASAPNVEDTDARIDADKKDEREKEKDSDSKRGRDRRDRSRSRDRKDRKRSHRSRDRSRERSRDRDRDRDRSRDRGRRRRRSRSRSRDRRRNSRDSRDSRDAQRDSQKDAGKPAQQQPLLKTPEVGPDGKWSSQPSQLLSTPGGVPLPGPGPVSAAPAVGPQDHDSRGPMAMMGAAAAPPQAMVLGMQPLQDVPRGLGQLWPPEGGQPDTDSRADDRNRQGPEGMMDFFGGARRGMPGPFNGPGPLSRPDGNGDPNAVGPGLERLGANPVNRGGVGMMDPRDAVMLGPGAMDHDRLGPGMLGPGLVERLGPGLMDRDRARPGMLEGVRNGPEMFERDMEEMDDHHRNLMFDRVGSDMMGRGPPNSNRHGPGFDRGGMDLGGPGMMDQGGMLDRRQGLMMESSMRGRGFMGRGGPRGRGMRGMMLGRPGRMDLGDPMHRDALGGPGNSFRAPEGMDMDDDIQDNRQDRPERHDRDREEHDRRGRERHSRDRDKDRYRDRHGESSGDRRRSRSGRRDDDRRYAGKDEFGRDLDLLKRRSGKDGQSLCIEIRNMSRSVSFADVRRFFSNFMIPSNGLKLINDSKGYRTGIGYVRFAHQEDYEAALRLSGSTMKNEVVEILPISDQIFDAAVDSFLPNLPREQYNHEDVQSSMGEFSTCIKCENLPINAKEEDLKKLFGEYQIEVVIDACDESINPIGYMKLRKPEDVKKLLSSPVKFNIEGNEIKLSGCADHLYDNAKAQQNGLGNQAIDPHGVEFEMKHNAAPRSLRDESPVVPINTDVLLLKNLPPSVRDRDITDFFSDVGLIPENVHILLNPFGQPIGEAFCVFQDGLEAAKGLRKDNTHMGKFIVNVKPVSRPEMGAILGVQTSRPTGPNGSGGSPGLGGPMGPMGPVPRHMMHPRMMGPGMPRHPLLGQGPQPYPARPPLNQGLEKAQVDAFGKPGCVIACENIPFRAGVEDIMAFFEGFEVKESNIIRRYDEQGRPTGDARVAFETPQEAQMVLQKLRGSKIYNRTVWMKII